MENSTSAGANNSLELTSMTKEGFCNSSSKHGINAKPVLNGKLHPESEIDTPEPVTAARQQWSNKADFLMSCIAMSVGLGNIWRFPYMAHKNGGGAFLIPYMIVLLVIGKPLYYMEMAMGQFSGYGCIKVWNMIPAFRGIAYCQIIASAMALTFYCALMAIALFYFGASFASELPWANCDPAWAGDHCVDSINVAVKNATNSSTKVFASSELYFRNYVLNEMPNIEDGIGLPQGRLTLCLFISWITIFVVIIKGVKSSGKAAYFLAMFPYVVLLALLVRGVTLPGAKEGLLYFLTPQLERLKDPEVWYDAVTQAFFSLTVCFGTTTAYASFNDFRNNIHRDVIIVTTMDTLTSLLAGCTTFAVLGNLAYEQGENVRDVVTIGTGLAFISYPSAIAKFQAAPQLFSMFFFIMLYALGVGSAVALVGLIVTAIRDQWPHLPYWPVALITCCVGFLVGLIYVTPGGQFVLTLVDSYSVTFTLFVLGCVQMAAIAWIYGVENFCQDLEFMLNRRTSLYWRLCWSVFTPILLIVILVYALNTIEPLQYNSVSLPTGAYVAGWVLFVCGVVSVPIVIIFHLIKNKHLSVMEILSVSFHPNAEWGPRSTVLRKEWLQYKEMKSWEMERQSIWRRAQINLFGQKSLKENIVQVECPYHQDT